MLCVMAKHKYVMQAHRGRTGLCYVICLHVPIRMAMNGISVVLDNGSDVHRVIEHVFGAMYVAILMFAPGVIDPIVIVFDQAFLKYVLEA